MQIEKSQPEGERILSEMRFAEFPELSVDPRAGISRSASKTDYLLFSYLLLNKMVLVPLSFYNLLCMIANSELHSEFFRYGV